jgi:3-oxoacyl-[acyl-carrier protein] reductase
MVSLGYRVLGSVPATEVEYQSACVAASGPNEGDEPAEGLARFAPKAMKVDLGIRGRAALVLGASSGIGEAIAMRLAGEGVRLAVAARRSEQLERVASQAKAAGATDARGFEVDVSDDASIGRLLGEVGDAYGHADIVILNGGGPKAGHFEELGPDDWDGAYRLLLRGTLRLAAGVVGPMRENRWGRIVALTSSSVKAPIDNLALSNTFRTAVVAAMRTLATDVAADGVTVNSIATGRIETDRLRQLYGNDEGRLRQAAADVPAGRIASPEEFAPLAVFLCGEPASYITGQTISVDGGLTRGLFG